MIPGSLLFDFPRKQKIGSVSIPEAVNPLPADNAFAGRGAIGWREQLYAVEKDLFLNFTKHNGGSCRNVEFYKTLAIEFLHGVYLVRNLAVAAIFLIIRGELNNKFL